MTDDSVREYDALVIGGGIAGMESALKLGDMGYRVILVERDSSVGGKMVLFSKVFPTLDCASCISTPKMGAVVHHPSVTALTYAEVESIRGNGKGGFRAKIREKPRYVDEAACTGCRQCEVVCNVAVPDEFNAGLISRRAAYIPFPQAVPKKAVVERAGVSPCTFNCPAGVKAHGYVALVRSGRYEEAFNLVCEATPLVGVLGRACYAPCETECTRGVLEGPVSIRRLKRFIADRHYADGGSAVEIPPPNGKKVAIVGSGPAGLTAAWHLARSGYEVKVFEAASRPGGMLSTALPAFRLPDAVVQTDIAKIVSSGVEIVTDTRVEDLEALRDMGYAAVLVATGTHRSTRLGVPGEDLPGVLKALDFLRAARSGEALDVRGKEVVIVGGGNVAIDAARTALRLGAARVQVVYRRSRDEMPANPWEIDEAEREGVRFVYLATPTRCVGDGCVESMVCQPMELGEADESGRRRPTPADADPFVLDAACLLEEPREASVGVPDIEGAGGFLVIVAAGLTADVDGLGLALKPDGTVETDPVTLQTAVPYIFAAGDVVDGPSSIAEAAGRGRRAAYMINRWLRGEELDPTGLGDVLPVMDKTEVLERQESYRKVEPWRTGPLHTGASAVAGPLDFSELEPPVTEEEALHSAGRCLDCGVCSECRQCVAICPADCIDLRMSGREFEAEVGAVILATGFTLFPADAKPQYGYGRYKNVITGMQMDRLLAPTRPYNDVVRPGDGRIPDNIAYILCTGSRDETVGNPLCSQICCMYSIKQNQLIMGALPLADVTVYYMDVRSVGKGYDEFYEQAKAMGAGFVRGRISDITEKEDGNLVLRYEDIENGGGMVEAEHDLVVLAVGVQPSADVRSVFLDAAPSLDEYLYLGEADEDLDPGSTDMPGVFVAGSAAGAKDIPDSILHAGAAVAQAAAHIEKGRETA
ncbi:MAG: FAD-dependent oxidoreductase [Actinobacteria bacterium]|jgi:heterodisulfide reductase subunit A|nr:FAD-dependent oxidoreductase [Actinomycetota bacterium]